MDSIRVRVQLLLEEDLPRVLAVFILSYLEEKVVCVRMYEGGFSHPYGVGVLPGSSHCSDEVVVADTYNHRIQVFTPEGKFLRMWGKEGSKAGEFRYPVGISTLSSREVIVADTCNHRIQVFTSQGKFLRMWGTEGSNPGEFHYPFDITVLSSGEVAVVDTFNHRIQVFSSAGKFLRMWGAKHGQCGRKAGEFYIPKGITLLPGTSSFSDEIVVADTYGRRIQFFTPEGKFLRTWGTGQSGAGEFNFPSGVSALPSREIAIVDECNDHIQVFTPEGKFVRMWRVEQGKNGSEAGKINWSFGISTLPSGEIIIADTCNHRIQVFHTLLD